MPDLWLRIDDFAIFPTFIMPEIAEVARIVHFLRQKLVGRTILNAVALDDNNVFGKVGTSGKEVEAALQGKKVVSAGSQGKYFWILLNSPPHLVMHFGMTGWVHIKGERTAYTNYYKKLKGSVEEWPPKFWKFHISTQCSPPVEVAFVDSRRFGRVRLVHCPGDKIRLHSPLVENGPDPVVDRDRFTEEYLRTHMKKRRVPIKALLLDQSVISGIGNWVADETLYQARLHPEQYSDTFSDEQMARLYEMVRLVCQTAVDKLAESDDFPDHWLFNYRWGKGSKGAASVLPNGEKLAFITVGGRTSCYAPNVQKKTGGVAPGAETHLIKAEPGEEEEIKPAPKKSRKRATADKAEQEDGPPRKQRRTKPERVKKEIEDSPSMKAPENGIQDTGQRRSARLRR